MWLNLLSKWSIRNNGGYTGVHNTCRYLVDVMLAQEARSSTLDKDQVDTVIRDVDFPAQKQKNVCC